MQDNGSYIGDADNSDSRWSKLLTGDGSFAATTKDGLFWYLSAQNAQIFRFSLSSNFEIQSFTRVDPLNAGDKPGQEYLFVNPFLIDPNNSNRMYLAGGNVMWRNINLSQIPNGRNTQTSINWQEMSSTELSRDRISAIAISTNPANVLYYATNAGEVFRVDNAHLGTGETTDITSFRFPIGYVACLAVDPFDANHLMVIFSNYELQSIFLSYDGGATFIAISGNLEEFPDGSGRGPSIRWGEIIPLADGSYQYIVGTSTGLYMTDREQGAETTWLKVAENTVGNSVIRMIKYRPLDGKIVVATHGNGVFTSQIDNPRLPESQSETFSLALSGNFPNPFNTETVIEYTLPARDVVRLSIYNPMGQLVRDLFWGTQFEGVNQIIWDGTNNAGVPLPDGIYILNATFQNSRVSHKMILQR